MAEDGLVWFRMVWGALLGWAPGVRSWGAEEKKRRGEIKRKGEDEKRGEERRKEEKRGKECRREEKRGEERFRLV